MKTQNIRINIEKNLNGSYMITDDKGNKEVYYGYTKIEAIKRFKEKFSNENKKVIK